jgi:hypothetical protein
MADVGLVVGFVPDVVLLYLSLVTMLVSTSAFAPSVLELPWQSRNSGPDLRRGENKG